MTRVGTLVALALALLYTALIAAATYILVAVSG
jgi:hypothetical protein